MFANKKQHSHIHNISEVKHFNFFAQVKTVTFSDKYKKFIEVQVQQFDFVLLSLFLGIKNFPLDKKLVLSSKYKIFLWLSKVSRPGWFFSYYLHFIFRCFGQKGFFLHCCLHRVTITGPFFHISQKCARFNLKLLDEEECLSGFWLTKQDIINFCHIFGFSDTKKKLNDRAVSSVEALSIVLRRLKYPCRYCGMVPRFTRSMSDLSLIQPTVKFFSCYVQPSFFFIGSGLCFFRKPC